MTLDAGPFLYRHEVITEDIQIKETSLIFFPLFFLFSESKKSYSILRGYQSFSKAKHGPL